MSGQRFNMDDFAKRVSMPTDPDACMEWQGARHPIGYGQFRGVYAHRMSWELFVGEIPKGGCVLHRCDNPPCVNPLHLFMGSRADNNRDMFAKGRNRTTPRYGSDHHAARLTWEDCSEMRFLRHCGATLKELSERYGVSFQHVHNIVTGKSRITS